MSEKQWVIVGLGNPGKKYEATRHNLGFRVVKALAHRMGWGFKEDKQFASLVIRGRINGTIVHLVLPLTYMNNSGIAVRQYLDYFKLGVQDLVVVVDDVALPCGQLRLRVGGGSGGHNGLKNIGQMLGTGQYVRLRVGIGPLVEEARQNLELVDYVLGVFTEAEEEHLRDVIELGVDTLMGLVKEPVTQIMNRVNVKNKEPPRGEQENKHESEQKKSL